MRVSIEGRLHNVDIEYLQDGKLNRHELTSSIATRLRPENHSMVRELRNIHQKANKPSLIYFHTTLQHIAAESRLEGDALLLLDFEADTAAISAQPFTLYFNRRRAPASHTPDFFQRLTNGQGVLINVKSAKRIDTPEVIAQFDASRQVCEQAGWQHRIITMENEYLRSNLRLLAGYKREPDDYPTIARTLTSLLADGAKPWGAVVHHITSNLSTHPATALAALLHAVYVGDVDGDLTQELKTTTSVAVRTAR